MIIVPSNVAALPVVNEFGAFTTVNVSAASGTSGLLGLVYNSSTNSHFFADQSYNTIYKLSSTNAIMEVLDGSGYGSYDSLSSFASDTAGSVFYLVMAQDNVFYRWNASTVSPFQSFVLTNPRFVVQNPSTPTKRYVSNGFDNTVLVMTDSGSSSSVTKTIAVGSVPDYMAFNPVSPRLYVANSGGNTISVINTNTELVIATITVQDAPNYIAVSPGGGKVFVSHGYGNNNICVIDTSNNTLSATIATGMLEEGYPVSPGAMTVNPAATKLYVAWGDQNSTITSFNISTYAKEKTASRLTSDRYPLSMAMNSDGTKLYWTTKYSNKINILGTP